MTSVWLFPVSFGCLSKNLVSQRDHFEFSLATSHNYLYHVVLPKIFLRIKSSIALRMVKRLQLYSLAKSYSEGNFCALYIQTVSNLLFNFCRNLLKFGCIFLSFHRLSFFKNKFSSIYHTCLILNQFF